MGRDIAIDTPDGSIGAWGADPEWRAVGRAGRGGVNAHIRSVADGYAAAGYVAVASDYFAPIERRVELGYDADGFARGRGLANALGLDRAVATTDAAARLLRGEA